MTGQNAALLEQEAALGRQVRGRTRLAVVPRLETLRELVAAELRQPVAPDVRMMAEAVAGGHPGARAVLFYGSCLRETRLDGRMLDFYLIVSGYEAAYDRPWLASANRILPPNVFPLERDGLMSKYAVLSEDHFFELCSSATRSVSVWARFAQPSRLVWSADRLAAEECISAVASAAPALLSAVRPCVEDRIDPLELWTRAFQMTYSAELRPERRGRAGSVVDAEPARYRAFALPALRAAGLEVTLDEELLSLAPIPSREQRSGRRLWRRRRVEGKALNVLRLVKASATYAGGLDYLAWKIARHTGVRPVVTPWQRRWPLLGALLHLPGLLARGVVR